MIKRSIKKIIPGWALDWYHLALAFLGALVYGFPSHNLIVIGVTGTKGKTSAVYFITKILEHAGHKVGALSSLHFKIGEHEEMNKKKMTMPGRFFIQRKLRRMVKARCTYAVCEVTSEGIAQYRHAYIDFDTAVFTNIAPEHIESHGSFEKYLAEKQKLFACLKSTRRKKHVGGKWIRIQKTIVANGDDARADDFLAFAADRKYCFHVGAHNDNEEISICEHIIAENVRPEERKTSFTVRETPCTLRLSGMFNVQNALAAISVGISERLTLPSIMEALGNIRSLPGRMEYIDAGQSFVTVVDYAHTPDSLDAVYRTLRFPKEGGKNPGRLICVLGAAGGGRDAWKRPLLGAIAGTWGDAVIITNEDPYDEDPMSIMEDVASGAQHANELYKKYFGEKLIEESYSASTPELIKILDRREAIRHAIALARPGDTLIITGKGAEQLMALKGGRMMSWDDRKVVREEIGRVARIS
ncbi:MAG: UDP-N-acetylmuramoyl-L-alanyl-D-glutamate--2,6-diaminopimelate ligase [bacterium]|nr:UDP-N-acetylmuramoyl-L-alanyl-D-glutamate--2,6-diaminopimelate ligase [bacterium]